MTFLFFLITADHVLAEAGRPKELSGQNFSLNEGKIFEIEVIDTPKEQSHDVALLRLKDASFRGPVTAIDISFWRLIPLTQVNSTTGLTRIGPPLTAKKRRGSGWIGDRVIARQ